MKSVHWSLNVFVHRLGSTMPLDHPPNSSINLVLVNLYKSWRFIIYHFILTVNIIYVNWDKSIGNIDILKI